jgi:hypothetical protein
MPGVFQFLSEFYLLLFFVCQIGRKSIDAALASHPNEFWWQRFRACQAWSERLFTRFLSVLNLYLLAIVVLLVPLSVPVSSHPFIAVGVTAILVIAAAFYLLKYRANPRSWPWVFVAGLVVAVALGTAVYLLLGTSSTYIAVLASWAGAMLVSLRLLDALNQRQPGVFWVALVAGLAITATLIYFLPLRGRAEDFIDAGLWTAEYVWAALAVLWVLFGFFSFLTGVTAIMTLLFAADRARTWRVVWTVAASLALQVPVRRSDRPARGIHPHRHPVPVRLSRGADRGLLVAGGASAQRHSRPVPHALP